MKTHTHTQQVGSLTARQDDRLLVIRWKWSLTEVFIPVVCLHVEQDEEGGVGLAVSGGREGGGMGAGQERQTHSV